MKLDAQQNRAGNLHVVYMRNAQATRIAEVLGGLLTGQANAAPGATGGAAGASGPAGGAQGGARPQNTASNTGGQMGQGMSGSSKGGLRRPHPGSPGAHLADHRGAGAAGSPPARSD
ncbi:hypothetical protein G6F57_022216 [Rhizopus arrhizus]|nr:hypothetical protein G6F57_022216 [Rhizopus arrhizus]